MAKAIYVLKMYLFRKEFKLTAQESVNFQNLSLFIVLTYFKYWFTAAEAISSPRHDLEFLKSVEQNSFLNEKIYAAVMKKLTKNHLSYLGEELIAFAFFDKEVSYDS